MLKIRIKNHRVNNLFQLSNIRINVLPKEIFALIGKSGSGKSTVAKIVVGLLQNEKGSVQVNGVELNDHNERLIPQFFKAGYLPQNLHLKPFHTVLDFLNIIFQKSTSPQKEINKYVKIFHLQKILSTQVTHLSGGEKQKLGILNAISEPIEYLVLDEPFSQLDTEQKLEFATIIQEIIEIKNIPCLLISHDLSDVKEHIDVYGADNHLRLTGKHETQSIDSFSYGVSDRGASIRIPIATVEKGWKGWLEDRRPNSAADPYKVAARIIKTVKTAKY